jgi:uncharacterized protein (TIGR02646 family)
MDCTYDDMRRSPDVVKAVEESLVAEQGSICAYTGLRIKVIHPESHTFSERDVDFHIEHLLPQTYCNENNDCYGKDTEYHNLVACWPRPNCGFEPLYGARKKGDWPSPDMQHLFVSPLDSSCSLRFKFNYKGEIHTANADDVAAEETIKRLGLNNKDLVELHKKEIQGALQIGDRLIKLNEARRLLARIKSDSKALDSGQIVQLRPFCFAIEQALEKVILKLKGIRKSIG